MKKNIFDSMLSSGSLKLSGYKIKNGNFSKTPYALGIYHRNDCWYVYKTDERGTLRLEKEFFNEDEGYDYLHKLILLEQKLENQ